MAEMNIREILRVLPHRYPMVMVDRVIECDDVKRIVAIKNVTVNEPYFVGHFPGYPVMPGVLQLEAMAQTGGILLTRLGGGARKLPLFMSIDKAKFRKMIQPGDQMRIEVEFLSIRTRLARFTGKIYVDGALASEAEMMCMITDEATTA